MFPCTDGFKGKIEGDRKQQLPTRTNNDKPFRVSLLIVLPVGVPAQNHHNRCEGSHPGTGTSTTMRSYGHCSASKSPCYPDRLSATYLGNHPAGVALRRCLPRGELALPSVRGASRSWPRRGCGYRKAVGTSRIDLKCNIEEVRYE
jgi:hypothetical protein